MGILLLEMSVNWIKNGHSLPMPVDELKGSKRWFVSFFHSVLTSVSRHFIAKEVSGNGRKSFQEAGLDCLGTEITVEMFHLRGTLHISMKAWKMKRKMPHSASAQYLSTLPHTPPGPELVLTLIHNESLEDLQNSIVSYFNFIFFNRTRLFNFIHL